MKLFLRTNERKGLLQFERTQLTGGEHLSSYEYFMNRYVFIELNLAEGRAKNNIAA